MVVYAVGTEETDQKKQNIAIQQAAAASTTNATNIATNTANIATNTANIATNTADIATNATNIATQTATLAALTGSKITNSLGADVNLNNAANFFDGPSVAQGSTGTWFASGGVTINDANTAVIVAKLWDGTTVIDSREIVVLSTQTVGSVSLSGFLASPAGNLRISVKSSSTTSKMVFNVTGLSRDCTITAFRLA